MNFSERYGYKPVREIIQIESMDEPLRNGLWSLLIVFVWNDVCRSTYGYFLSNNSDHKALCEQLWFRYFKLPLDNLDDDWTTVLEKLKSHFFSFKWNEVYDFIEFIANNYNPRSFRENFTKKCNHLFETEMSAYRFVDGKIARITDPCELAELDEALVNGNELVRAHLRRALELLSDRQSPDYRNSIKESISAVECFVRITTGEERSTLGQLLKKLQTNSGLHPSLGTAFSKLYGYTSDNGGIRHALTELENTDFNDAKFMLVVCSAFVNFVSGKEQNKALPYKG